MSYARCKDCGALIDTDDDPEAAAGDGFVCGFCRGVCSWAEAVETARRLYDRMRKPMPDREVKRG